ncbi:MAG: ATP-binding protein [Myxococcota bacterium]
MSMAHLFGPPTIDDVRARAATVALPRPVLVNAAARVLAESGSLLLCGPPGSGRSHALRMVAATIAERGRTPVVLHAGGTAFAAVSEAVEGPIADVETGARRLATHLRAHDGVLLIDDWPDLDGGSQKVVQAVQESASATVIATGPVARLGWRVVPLAPLTGAEVEALLSRLLASTTEWSDGAPSCDVRLVETALALAGPWPGPVVRFAQSLIRADALTYRDGGRPTVREQALATLLRSFTVDPVWPLPRLAPPVVRLATVIAWAQPIDLGTAIQLARGRISDVDELVRVRWLAERSGVLRFAGPVARRLQRESDPEACTALVRHWKTLAPTPWLRIASVLGRTADPGLLADLGARALQALLPVDPAEALDLALMCPPPLEHDPKGIACFLECHGMRAQADHQRHGPEAALRVIDRVPVTLGARTPARARFDRIRGQLYWALGRTREAAGAYEAAAGTGSVLPLVERARLLHHAGTAFAEVGDMGGAVRCFEAALEAFRPKNQPRSVMAVARGLCAAYAQLGEREKAEQAGREALELARSLAFERLAVLVRLDLADAAIAAGDLEGAEGHLDDAADAAVRDPGREPHIARRLAQLAVQRRDARGADLAQRAVASAVEHEALVECGLGWALCAWAEAQAGDDEACQRSSRHALRILRQAGAGAELALARLFLAEACLEVSRHEEASDHAEAVVHFANEFARPPLHDWAQRVLMRARGPERRTPVQRLTNLATRIALRDNLDELLAELASATVELMVADRAMVVLIDQDGTPRPVAQAGAHAYAAPSMSIVERVLSTGREVVATDLAERGDLRERASVVAMNLHAAIGLPLAVEGEVLGALYLDSQHTPTGEMATALALLRALAAHASVALHQARLTESIRQRAAAAERAWRYADDLLRAVPTPVVIAEPTGATVDLNRAAEEWLTQDTTPVTERLEPLSGGFAEEYHLRTDDGRQVPVHVTRSEAVAPDGRTLTLFGFTDLSTRIAAEAQMARAAEIARESTAAKSRFLLSMSHELRTPLNAITGYAEMLIEDLDDEMACDDLGRVVASAKRLLGLIDNVLDISRIEAGRLDVELEMEDLADTIATAARRLRPFALERGISLSCECHDLGRFCTDHNRVDQVVDQLVKNAIEHAGASEVAIVARADVDHVTIEVSDDGSGIPEERMATLFQPFQRLDPAERPGGAGLGLAIGFRIAQRLGGVLSVDTVRGQGSRFRLFLPRADFSPPVR